MWRPPLWLVALLMLMTLILGSGVNFVRGAENRGGNCTESPDVCAKFSDFWQAWNLAEERFVDPKAINSDNMISGAVNGMLDSLGDQGHTFYMTKEQAQSFQEDLQRSFEGIGAYVDMQGNVPIIVSPIDGSPAEAAGILPGDQILRVDGQTTEGLLLNDVVSRIRGPRGTKVVLQIRHAGQEGTVDLTITRASVTVQKVTWRMLPGKIAHIRLSEFSEDVDKDMRKALQDATAQGARGIIMDVRSNPGGLRDQAVKVTSLFIPSGQTVLAQVARDGTREVFKSEEKNPFLDLPMVVLVNNGSASSAEIFAGALQDYDRATIVGVPTAGTGTVTSGLALEDGSVVQLGIAQWQTPKGRHLRREGVTPDLTVALSVGDQILIPSQEKKMTDQEILQSSDLQLRSGLSLLGVQDAIAAAPAALWPR